MSSSTTVGAACFVDLDASCLVAADEPFTETVFDERNGLFEVFDTCLTSSVAAAAEDVLPPALFAAAREGFAWELTPYAALGPCLIC